MAVRKMTKLAVLSALALILMYLIRFPIIPAAPYLEYEPADVPVLVAGFIFGPFSGLIVAFIVAFLQAVTVSAGSGWVGFVMHIISTGTFVVVASLIYRRFHSFKGAIFALVIGAIAMTLIMIPANLFFTVHFFGVPRDVVKSLLIPAIIPFNIIKAFGNALIVMLIYKPLSSLFKQF